MAKWSSEQTLVLIEFYEEHPELWDVSIPQYRNKEKKAGALQEIAETLDVSTQEISRKWHNIRCQMNSELRKIRKKKSAGGFDDVTIKSNWEYFDALSFMISTQQMQEDTYTNMNGSSLDPITNQDQNSSSSLDSPVETPKNVKSKRKNGEQMELDSTLKKIVEILTKPHDDASSFAEFVGSEIRAIKSEKYKMKAKRAITNALFEVAEEAQNDGV